MEMLMPDYQAFNDEELQHLASGGDGEAAEVLAARYQQMVRACARPFFLTGGDSEDLIQEGMLGFWYAILRFDPSRSVSFKTFAEVCIRNRILSAIKSASSMKHTPLNDRIPLEASAKPYSAETRETRLVSPEDTMPSPEEQVLARESVTEFFTTFAQNLSPLEQRILHLFLEGLSYRSIADALSKDIKSVDNAVQRIRRKLTRHLSSGEFSES